MDTTTIDTAADFVNDTCPEIEDISFPKEIAKTLALSAVTTAGMVLGLAAAAVVVQKFVDHKKARRDKKNTLTVVKTDLSEKTPENEKN